MKEKYAYFLNAIYYSISKIFIKIDTTIDSVLNSIIYNFLRVVITIFFRNRLRAKYLDRAEQTRERVIRSRYIGKYGTKPEAERIFSGVSCSHIILPTGVTIGILTKLHGVLNPIVYMPIIVVMVAIAWYPVRKAVFDKDRYLKYFKKFEKKDKQWRRKWMLITIAYFVLNILCVVIGIYLFFAMAIGRFDIWNLMHRH